MIAGRGAVLIPPERWCCPPAGSAVGVDFETYYSTDYSVRQCGTWAYCQDERFDAYLVAVSDGTQTCVCPPEDFSWETIAGLEWVSHNRDFDRAVHRRLQELGKTPKADPEAWHCSAALCSYLQFPRDLKGAAKAALGETIDKTVRVRLRGRRSRSSSSTDVLGAELLNYAARDAEVCLELWDRFSDGWPAHERQLFDITSGLGRFGLCIDWAYVSEKRKELEKLVAEFKSNLPFSPALSIKQFQVACKAVNIPPPRSTAANDPGLVDWLDRHNDTEPASWARSMQRIRSANRTSKVLEAMEARRMPSGRLSFELKYCGASTGRWSGGGGLNLQNLNRKATAGVDMRRVIVPPPGHRLAVVDYAQIESRILLFLAGDTGSVEMFRSNPNSDAYEIHARATMGYTESESLKTHCDRTGSNLRHFAKARVLGLGFGCGWRRFIEVAKTMAGLDLDEDGAKGVVKNFRLTNPQIVGLWSRLQAACDACDGSDYVLPLPCTQANPALKRRLIYRDVVVDDAGIACTVGGKRIRVFGGLLAENWTQATARDVLASAWLRCGVDGYMPVLCVHDELVFELRDDTAAADLERILTIMETSPAWAPNLPLKAEGNLMDCYRK